MSTKTQPPKDAQTVLLRYTTYGYNIHVHRDMPTGDKWEECRWVSREKETGSKPHWEPWCGNARIWTTHHIEESDILDWLEVPDRNA